MNKIKTFCYHCRDNEAVCTRDVQLRRPNGYKLYVNQRPNIKQMRSIVEGLGWDVAYKYGFTARWVEWLRYCDCEYELIRNYTR